MREDEHTVEFFLNTTTDGILRQLFVLLVMLLHALRWHMHALPLHLQAGIL